MCLLNYVSTHLRWCCNQGRVGSIHVDEDIVLTNELHILIIRVLVATDVQEVDIIIPVDIIHQGIIVIIRICEVGVESGILEPVTTRPDK